MRSFTFFSFSFLLAALSIGLAQASFSQTCKAEICGEASIPVTLPSFRHRVGKSTKTTATRRRVTNAQRLARGLPPLPPTRRADSCLLTPAPQTSAAPQTTYEGVIQIKKVSNGVPTDVVGYLSSTAISGGFFPTMTTVGSALLVTFALDSGASTGTAISLTMTNSAGPLLGFIQGRDSTSSDIASNSFNYLYLNGIALPGTGAGCPAATLSTNYVASPDRAAESSIWNIDLTTGALVPQWINSDLSDPTTEIWMQSGFVYAGGSMSAFAQKYPAVVTEIALFFIPM